MELSRSVVRILEVARVFSWGVVDSEALLVLKCVYLLDKGFSRGEVDGFRFVDINEYIYVV